MKGIDDMNREQIIDYVKEVSRVRNEHIQNLLIQYFERAQPNPIDVVLVEENRGLKTYWYFMSKGELGEGN